MKKLFIFLSVLLSLCACSSDDPVDDSEGGNPDVLHYTSTVEHSSYQVGFENEAIFNAYETNSYTVIAMGEMWKENWYFIPKVVEKPEISKLLYSYDTEEYYMLFGKKHYYTETHNYYAYYSAIVEWDWYDEYKGSNGITEARSVEKNIKCTVKYVGCTKNTPSMYIPTVTSPEVITYSDIEGAWNVVSSGSGSGESPSGGDISTRKYSYYCRTTCYNENLGYDDLFIYKNGSEYRASWEYDAKGMPLGATMKIYQKANNIDGMQFKYYIIPMGLNFYFNF